MKRGFTLIELIFVIVIIGILSAVLVPRFDRPTLTEAAHQLVSHIRYTQHLAMVDNKFDSNKETWFKDRWQLLFARSVDSTNVWAYTIFSDKSNHDRVPNHTREIARDPINPGALNAAGHLVSGQYLSGGYSGILPLTNSRRNKKMSLGEKYTINWVTFTKSCSTENPPNTNQSRRIIFDNIGRPYYHYKRDLDTLKADTNPYSDMMLIENQCIISLCTEDKCIGGDIIQIAIEPETGYTHIL